MTTRERVIEIIQNMSEAEVEAEYLHLREATDLPAADDEFEEALDAMATISRRVSISTDVEQLVRNERDWLAGRAP